MFSGKDTQMDNTNRLKEGSLKKESRHRKVWRERWVVLTEANIYTFEKSKILSASKIDTLFIGKTGTLCEDKFEING